MEAELFFLGIPDMFGACDKPVGDVFSPDLPHLALLVAASCQQQLGWGEIKHPGRFLTPTCLDCLSIHPCMFSWSTGSMWPEDNWSVLMVSQSKTC